jgi:Na+/melibiose symporter-like transporter
VTRGDYLAYGLLRAPLALLELPLFVLLPAFYADQLGLSLATVGAVLFFTRAVDAVADPAIGTLLDRQREPQTCRRWILFGLPVLALGYAAVFLPPPGVPVVAWLALASIATYLAYSVVSIAYQTWGAGLGSGPIERVRVTATREAAGLAGVLLSASLLVPERAGWLVALFFVTAAIGALAIMRAPLPATGSPVPAMPAASAGMLPAGSSRIQAHTTAIHDERGPGTQRAPAEPARSLIASIAASWRQVAGHRPFRWMLAAFLANGIASAIPATLVLFFVADVLQAPGQAPMFLILYFLAAAVGMPLWVRIARRLGLRRTWLVGMALSIAAFGWAFGLGAGDTLAFGVICLMTGLALGADLAMPPAILATILAADDAPRDSEGSLFGIWNLATKVNLAAAAGLALPLLEILGYLPGELSAKAATASAAAAAGTQALSAALPAVSSSSGTLALSAIYALLPCLLKLIAGVLLLRAPLPPDTPSLETRP